MTPLRSLRLRLLWQYLLTVGLLLAGAELALFALFRWAGERELDTELRKEVEKIANALEVDPKGQPKVKGKKELLRKQPHSRTVAWEVLSEGGRLLAHSDAEQGMARQELPERVAADTEVERLYIADGTGRVRAARLRTVRQGKEKGKATARGVTRTFDVRVTVDRSGIDEQSARLGWYLALGFPLLLGVSGLAGAHLIRRAVRPVDQAFERERRFTGSVSHELRTPLTALRGEIDVTLRRLREPGEYEATLRRISVLVGRMSDLIEGMLVLARSECGHLLDGAREVSLLTFQQTLEEMVRLLPGHERVTISGAFEEGAKFLGDGLLLTLAIRNLIENALVHGKPAAPVAVNLAIVPPGWVKVTVTDGDSSVPEERIQRSGQTTGSERRKAGAGGLGLSIAQAIAEAHGGSLRFEKRSNGGCLATIGLPLARTGPCHPTKEQARCPATQEMKS